MQVWPNLGLHYASQAKIASLLQRDDEAIKASQAAVRILQCTHAGSNVLQEQVQLLHSLQQEKDTRHPELDKR